MKGRSGGLLPLSQWPVPQLAVIALRNDCWWLVKYLHLQIEAIPWRV